jgi:hypothetical protein
VVFDDSFGSTVCATKNEFPSNWPSLFEHARYSLFDSDVNAEFIPTLSKDFADPPDIRKQHVTFIDASEAASEGVPSVRSNNHPLWSLKKTLMTNSKIARKMKTHPYLRNQEMDGAKITTTSRDSDKDLQ